MNFCIAILILKMVKKIHIFGILCFLISRKVKTELKCKKRIVQCMEKVLCWIERVRSGVRFRAGDFSLDVALQWVRPVEVDSHQIETLIENNQHSTTWKRTGILKNIQINKVLGEKEKCVFHFKEKTKRTFWPTQYFLGDTRNLGQKVFCLFVFLRSSSFV